jgi:hypothetical protein
MSTRPSNNELQERTRDGNAAASPLNSVFGRPRKGDATLGSPSDHQPAVGLYRRGVNGRVVSSEWWKSTGRHHPA